MAARSIPRTLVVAMQAIRIPKQIGGFFSFLKIMNSISVSVEGMTFLLEKVKEALVVEN